MDVIVAKGWRDVDPATIKTLRERLGATPEERRKRRPYQTPLDAFGHLTLAELEPMSLEIAEWQATLPAGYRYAIMRSLRQVLNAAVRWKLMQDNPANDAGANPQPRREEVAFFGSLAAVDLLAAELGPRFGPIVVFGVETGLRPSEWAALERRHLDRGAAVVQVRRSVVDGRVKEYGKTNRAACGFASPTRKPGRGLYMRSMIGKRGSASRQAAAKRAVPTSPLKSE